MGVPKNSAMANDVETKSQEKRRKKRKLKRSSEEGNEERASKTHRIDPLETEKAAAAEEEEKEGEEKKENQTETNQKQLKQSGTWKNLDLILSLQNKEFHIQRKIEFAFDFVKLKVKNSEGADDAGNDYEIVSVSRLIVFLNDWVQSLLIAPDKKLVVERSGVRETCLDYRCWVVFKFCLEESSIRRLSLSFLPNLLRAVSCTVKDALAKLDDLWKLETEGFKLYSLVSDCVSLIFSSPGRVFNANIDLWANTVSAVLDLVHKIYSCHLAGCNAGPVLLRLSCLVLEPFAIISKVHPNPKNIFPVFVDKLLVPLLSLLVVLSLETDDHNPAGSGNLLKMVEDILSNGLFHPAHLDGFLSTHDPKTVIKSYHRHFFQKLGKIMAEKKISALGGAGVGELYRLFVIRVKKQKGASVLSEEPEMTGKMGQLEFHHMNPMSKVSAGKSASIPEKSYSSSRLDVETSKSLFDLFVRFMEPMLVDMKRYSETNLEEGSMLLDGHCTLKSINKILAGFMLEKIYVRTEDASEGASLNFLKEAYNTVLSFYKIYLHKIKRGRHMETSLLIAKELIVAVSFFLEIEYEIVENDLVSLWLMMLSLSALDLSLMDTPDRCVLTLEILHLGSQLVNIYSELRQVNKPIFALCKAVRLFGFHDNDNKMDYSRRLICTHLSPESCVKSVAMILCAQRFRLDVSNAVKSIPEGQASSCIRELKTDMSESLGWMKVTSSRAAGKEFGEPNLRSCSRSYLSLQSELLGRALSEVYTLILDSLTITSGNSVLVGNSLKDLMTVICPSLSTLVVAQPDSVNEFLFSVTGGRIFNPMIRECENDCENDSPTIGPGTCWILMFFFRLYISCRSLYRQSVSLMPPDLSRKASGAMGDLFTAYSGKEWLERTDHKDEGYFSWIIKPSASLLAIIQTVSDMCLLDSLAGSAPLIYVLYAMAFQRLVDLNRQIKASEYLQVRVVRLVEMKLVDDSGLPLSSKESKTWKRRISVLRQEAADLTSFVMGYLSLVVPHHEDDAWDLGVCTVDEKSLPTAFWWILCQNTDIWSSHATKKKLKKFVSLLLCNSLSCVSSSLRDVEKQNIGKPCYPRNVRVQQISLRFLSDIDLYEQTFLRRHLTSRLCRILEKSVLSIFSDSLVKDIDFNTSPDWQEILGILEKVAAIVPNDTNIVHNGFILERSDLLQSNLLPMVCQKGQKVFPLINVELATCQSLLNLLCWMPKSCANSKSFSVYATYILNLERLVVCSLLNFHGKLYLHNHYELFRLFVSCRRALKYLVIASCEEKMEDRQSSVIPLLSESSFSVLWLLKSVSAVLGLPFASSEEQASRVKHMIFSLMDHTSYVLLTISKNQFSLAVHSLIFDEKPLSELSNSDVLSEQGNCLSFDSSEHFDAWKIVVLVAEILKEQTKSLLNYLKTTFCNATLEVGVSVIDLNKLSSMIACIQGFLWGFASVLDNLDEKCCTVKTKSLRWKLCHITELNFCINVFEDFISMCLHMFLVENDRQPESLCHDESSKLYSNNDTLSSKKSYKSSPSLSRDKTGISSGRQQESLAGGMGVSAIDSVDDHEITKFSGIDVKNSNAWEKKFKSDHMDFSVNTLNAADSFDIQNLKQPLLRSLLKGENPEVAFLLGQLFVASSATLRLKLQIKCSSLSSSLMPIFIGISQFLLLQLADMVEVPHSFSFVWLDGVLKYLEIVGSQFSFTNPMSSRDVYTKLIDIHLRAIGRCISLQGKGATLASHETESSTKTLWGQIGFESSPRHEPYSLNAFKARLRVSFKVFVRKPLELHLLSAVQAVERALVGAKEGCSMIYELNTGSPDGGKVSSIVAAGVDCLDLLLESVSGRKRLNVVKRHIQSLIGALFNIILHLQSPLIFCGKLTCSKDDPDPGSVILMCVEVLMKVAGKHTLFQMDSCHVGQSLHIPAALFKDFRRLKGSQAPSNSSMFSDNGVDMILHALDQQFLVDLFAACCRLLCTVLRHHKSESVRCIALLEEAVTVLLHCLETVDTDLVIRKGYFTWEVQEEVKCASFLRRVYEEIRQQKDVLGQYCFHFLSNYICIYSGYGPLKAGIRREVDEALRPGVYALIDTCSPDDLQQLHTVLGEGTCRNTLATLQHDYKLNFQYEGKV